MNWFSEKICQLQNLFHASPAKFVNTSSMVTENSYHEELSDLKVVELKSIAKEKGLKGYTGLRKAELIEMLQQN
jgi:hypothetical protein